MKTKGRALLIDGSNYLFRGAFSVQPLTANNGMSTSGIKGFMNILIADIQVLQPTHIVVAFDKRGKTWRKKLYPEYKANREGRQKDPRLLEIYEQAPVLRKLLRASGFRVSTRAGVEADDVIGSLAVDFSSNGLEVIIGSKDKDFAQLVNKKIKMLNPDDRTLLDRHGIHDKYGVYPKQVIDYLALLGDSSDNIPGVFRCGAKTAAVLLQKYGTLEEVQRHKSDLTPSLRKNLELVEDKFDLTRKLLKIKTDFVMNTTLDNCFKPTSIKDSEIFNELCDELALKQTKKQIEKVLKGK